jgi:hypothetical protein
MLISTIKNRYFAKTFMNPAIRTKVNFLGKNFCLISLQKNLVLRMLSHRENVRNSKFWQKFKEKKRNFVRKFAEGI